MTDYQDYNTGYSGERKGLPAGTYGSNTLPGLKIVSYIGVKETKTAGLFRHSFLVASTDTAEGTAFLPIQLRDEWLTEGSIDLAFDTKGEKKKVEESIRVTAQHLLADQAVKKALANNTPSDQLETASEEIFNDVLTQIRINIGTIWRLQDWAGVLRDPNTDKNSLVGVEFSGIVAPGIVAGSSDVKSIFSKKKPKPVTTITDEDVPF